LTSSNPCRANAMILPWTQWKRGSWCKKPFIQ